MKRIITTKEYLNENFDDLPEDVKMRIAEQLADTRTVKRYDISECDLPNMPDHLRQLLDENNDGKIESFTGSRVRISVRRTKIDPYAEVKNRYDLTPPEGAVPEYQDDEDHAITDGSPVGKILAIMLLGLLLVAGALYLSWINKL